jgi:glycosyltransferase involved in cell wall biosynthesis
MRIVFFGTYDAARHPRVAVLREGLAASGDEVVECNVPLDLDTAARLELLRRPWRLPAAAARLGRAWTRLRERANELERADAVVVGYLGHFDVHLARRLFRGTTLVLDHLVSAADTAGDRRIASPTLLRLLERVDRAAVRAADVVCVDTEEHRRLLPEEARGRAVVVPVGAEERWFRRPVQREAGPVRVVFFGLYTPLQGAPMIGEAIALLAAESDLALTMVGRGQDYDAARAAGAANAQAAWRDWVGARELPELVAGHDVCLGIFGTTPKAGRVVPNKVFQGAAAGCAVVTADTPPQRAALRDAATFVPAGDASALADALLRLAADRELLWGLRQAAYRRADEAFRPAAVVRPLRAKLAAE